jgi:hypothetical protein
MSTGTKPTQKFFRWLTRAREREARLANNTSKVLAIVEALQRRGWRTFPKDPARYGDYILFYGEADDILALRAAGGIALNKKVGNSGLRPSDFLLGSGFSDTLKPKLFIAALPLIDFDRKALSYLSQSDRLLFEFTRAELNLGHVEKTQIRELINRVQERTPQPSAA